MARGGGQEEMTVVGATTPFPLSQPASLCSFDHVCVLRFVLRHEDRAECKIDIFSHSALLELTCDNNRVISMSDKGLEESKMR